MSHLHCRFQHPSPKYFWHALEARLEALQRTVKHFEDHASEWKTAYDQASDSIKKAETLRSEYDGMMAKLRQEDDRIFAKQKEMEKKMKSQSKMDANARFSRLQEISEEVDDAEGDIAAKEIALKRMRAAICSKEKIIAAEEKVLSLLEKQIVDLAVRKRELESNHVLVTSEEVVDEDHSMSCFQEEDDLSVGFSDVCV